MTGQELVDSQFVGEVAGPVIGSCVVMAEDHGSGTEIVRVRDGFVALGNPVAVRRPLYG